LGTEVGRGEKKKVTQPQRAPDAETVRKRRIKRQGPTRKEKLHVQRRKKNSSLSYS